jgi:hypothetical protein
MLNRIPICEKIQAIYNHTYGGNTLDFGLKEYLEKYKDCLVF